MGLKCTGSLQACVSRISRLAANGAPAAGANNLVVTGALIQINWKVVLKTGAQIELENGCGDICMSFQGRDRIKSVDLDMQLCVLDAEQIELQTGANLIVVDGVNVGWSLPDSSTDLDNEVSVEAWSMAWDGDEQAVDGTGDVLWHHWVWPRTTWVFGDGGLSNDALRVPLVGHGTSNSAFGDGPGNDMPWGAVAGPMGEFVTPISPPEPTCGYQSLVAS